ncbi:MAG: 2-amino-4-hydroxy-6-hydroxymethyldihydropteridine diphosphokinase [Granulosicoccaceae bacterium]
MHCLPDHHVIIALGANLDQPVQQLLRAFEELDDLPQSRLVRRSSLYGSTPIGPVQPDYVNAVAHVSTQLTPHQLLDELQAIERAHHRRREQRWGARTLDLDIALFAQLQIDDERLTVPHPYLHERVFVLAPLAELYPELHLPHRGVSVLEQLDALPSSGIWPLDDSIV